MKNQLTMDTFFLVMSIFSYKKSAGGSYNAHYLLTYMRVLQTLFVMQLLLGDTLLK